MTNRYSKQKKTAGNLARGGLLRLNFLDLEVKRGKKDDRACEVIV